MKRRWLVTLLGAAALVVWSLEPLGAQIGTVSEFLQRNLGLMSALAEPQVDLASFPAGNFKAVKPQEFDPGDTRLVQSAWLIGIGCPNDARIALPNPSFTGVGSFQPYQDSACAFSGDPGDNRNEGLLLAKTGPTNNFAAAVAELINVKGILVQELGYDIRKPVSPASPMGSHCGAGAPRFNVITSDGLFFVGCNSPPPTVQAVGNGWLRLRWNTTTFITGAVQRIVIVFDEGQDTGPDFFGAAILDNIDVNTVMVGRGATDAS